MHREPSQGGDRLDDCLRRQLRNEASSVKDCFTRFSFQSLALSGLAFGAIVHYQRDEALVGLLGIVIIILALTVSRIGAYKYATANRHFSYELFCDSVATSGDLKVGWEEALRAWRIVRATLFEKIYFSRGHYQWFDPRRYVRYNNVQRDGLGACRFANKHVSNWFDVASQAAMREPHAIWYQGNYLRTMQWILHFVAVLALVPIFAMSLQIRADQYDYLDLAIGQLTPEAHSLGFAITVVASLVVWLRITQVKARRQLLENGLLSIAVSAIVWQVVITAHRSVVEQSGFRHSDSLLGLGKVAAHVAASCGCIWDWLDEQAQAAAGDRTPKDGA